MRSTKKNRLEWVQFYKKWSIEQCTQEIWSDKSRFCVLGNDVERY